LLLISFASLSELDIAVQDVADHLHVFDMVGATFVVGFNPARQ
jgi:hypothetical protein